MTTQRSIPDSIDKNHGICVGFGDTPISDADIQEFFLGLSEFPVHFGFWNAPQTSSNEIDRHVFFYNRDVRDKFLKQHPLIQIKNVILPIFGPDLPLFYLRIVDPSNDRYNIDEMRAVLDIILGNRFEKTYTLGHIALEKVSLVSFETTAQLRQAEMLLKNSTSLGHPNQISTVTRENLVVHKLLVEFIENRSWYQTVDLDNPHNYIVDLSILIKLRNRINDMIVTWIEDTMKKDERWANLPIPRLELHIEHGHFTGTGNLFFDYTDDGADASQHFLKYYPKNEFVVDLGWNEEHPTYVLLKNDVPPAKYPPPRTQSQPIPSALLPPEERVPLLSNADLPPSSIHLPIFPTKMSLMNKNAPTFVPRSHTIPREKEPTSPPATLPLTTSDNGDTSPRFPNTDSSNFSSDPTNFLSTSSYLTPETPTIADGLSYSDLLFLNKNSDSHNFGDGLSFPDPLLSTKSSQNQPTPDGHSIPDFLLSSSLDSQLPSLN
ncbi:hypothetical protein BLNAU_8830 [Blattamonas nauphoetae]|uniref:Uncharacterized protein n=1 Tax=Blattamonas nauphoetae TaxID=2049346 RepID=A0ABQ9XXQ6_9EUKA|nr:hypothetical protein BLNAU_8830 [Blattamonas nauphoetae]